MKEKRTKVHLDPQAIEILERGAKKHGVTLDLELEAMTLYFLKTHDAELYEEAKKSADPKALELVEKAETE